MTATDKTPMPSEMKRATTTVTTDVKKKQPVKNSPGLFKYSTKHGKVRFGVRYRDHLNRSTEKMGFERVLDARRFQKENGRQLEQGNYVAPSDGKITLDKSQEEYLESKKVAWAETYETVWTSRWRARVTAELGHLQVRHIRAPILQRWVNEMVSGAGLSPNYCTTLAKSIGSVLQYGQVISVVGKNPADQISLPRRGTAKRRIYLSDQQVRDVAYKLEDPHRTIFVTLAYTGLRWGELAALRVSAIDLGAMRITVDSSATRIRKAGGGWQHGLPKSGKMRKVPLAPHLVPMLTPYVTGRDADDLLFPPAGRSTFMDQPNKPAPGRTPSKSSNWLWMACTAAGVSPVSAHELRHTCASLAVQKGASVKSLQTMLGHATASMTLDVYADLFDSDLDSVASLLSSGWDKSGRSDLNGTGTEPLGF